MDSGVPRVLHANVAISVWSKYVLEFQTDLRQLFQKLITIRHLYSGLTEIKLSEVWTKILG